MECLKLTDVFINGFYNTFQKLYPTEYETLFNSVSSLSLDVLFLSVHGEKNVIRFFTYKDEDTIVKICYELFYNKWLKYKSLFDLDYDVLNPYYQSTNETDGVKKETERNDNEDVYKIPYNTDDKRLDNSNIISNSETVLQDSVINKTVKGNNGNTPLTTLLSSEIEFRKNSFYTLVNIDIAQLISLNIY